MKYLILIVLILISSFMYASSKLPYAVTCKVCQEYYRKHKIGCYKCYAWREFNIPHITKDGIIYTQYRCAHGHTFLVKISE